MVDKEKDFIPNTNFRNMKLDKLAINLLSSSQLDVISILKQTKHNSHLFQV